MSESGNMMGWVASALLGVLTMVSSWMWKSGADKNKEMKGELESKQEKEICAVVHQGVNGTFVDIKDALKTMDEKSSERDEKIFDKLGKIEVSIAKMNGER